MRTQSNALACCAECVAVVPLIRPGKREVEWDAVVHAAYRHKDQPELLEYLVEQGCGLNGRERGQTAFHVLARRGDVRGVRLLLEKGAVASQLDSTGRPASAVTRNASVRELLRADGG